ncbi:MAG: hypothetical protein JJLCMIEE_01215 [Acidimicrobiales bacterium]|nr:hypothetical protein [Acidimicrobiales bacterium]
MGDNAGGDDRLQESLLQSYRSLAALHEGADPHPVPEAHSFRLTSSPASRGSHVRSRIPSINNVNWRAVISVGLGSVGLVAALFPVLFLAAASAGLCGVITGLLAYRKAVDTTAVKGKRLSIVGMLAGMVSLALAVGGYSYVEANNDSPPHPLKDMVARADPADYEIDPVSCAVVDGQAQMSGTVTNRSERTRGFTVQGRVTDHRESRDLIGYATVLVLASGNTTTWSFDVGPVGDEVDCEVQEVFYFA